MNTGKRNRRQKLLSALLCISLLFASFPAMSFAESEAAGMQENNLTTATEVEKTSQPETEIKSLRDETVKHFRNEDGSFTAVNYMTPIHYQEESSEEWTEIDNTLTVLGDGDERNGEVKYIPQNSPIQVQLADDTDSESLVDLQGEEHRISWAYLDLKSVKAEKKIREKDKKTKENKHEKRATAYQPEDLIQGLTDGLVYEDIAEGADLEVILDGTNLKENIILKDKHAQTQYVIRYDIGSLVAEETDEHTIVLKDGDSKTVFTIHAPYMSDAAGAVSEAVSLHIFDQYDGMLEVVLTVDKQWVNGGDSTVQLNAHKVTESWTASDIINQPYNSAPAANNTVIDYITASSGTTVRGKSFDISRVVKDWYAEGGNYGICVKADSSTPNAMAKFVASDNPEYPSYRPFITVRYLNNKGLEDRWTYHSQSPGEKGTGYVNDYTGNLVYTVPLVETTGELMPATISLVYNGYQSGRVDQITTVGNSWRLNIQQRIVKLTANNTSSSSADVNSLYNSLYASGYRYIYEDADGTDHYFRAKENSSTIFVDEEGLGLELKEITTTDTLERYQLTAEDGSKLTFTGRGYLARAYDNEGNFYKVLYSGNPAGAINAVIDGAGRTISFTRDSGNQNRITKVTGPDNRPVNITYTDGGRIQTVEYPDGNVTGFAYEKGRIIRVRGTDNTRIKYTYATASDSNPARAAIRNRVVSVTEYNRNSTAACEDAHKGQWIDISYGKNRTTFTDKDGQRHVYQFDNYGRTISVNDAAGAFSSYSYINPSSNVTRNTKKAHLLSSTAATSSYVDNLLVDHSFERGAGNWYFNASASRASDDAYLGSRSVKLTSSGSIASQQYSVSPGQVYTFSAYVKTSAAGVLPKLRIAFYDASDTKLSHIDSAPRENKVTWARMQLPFEVPTGASSVRVTFRMEGSGTAWFDCAQLETGSVMNRYNLVENSGFDKALTGTWSGYNTVSGDGRKTDNGNYVSLSGEGNKVKRFYQRIEVDKSGKNLYFSVSGQGKSTSVPFTDSSKRFALTLHTVFTDSTSTDTVIRFNPAYIGAQYTAGIAGTGANNQTKTVDYIEIRCVYNYNENTAEFDKIQINLDESGASYAYDENGNLITAADNAGRNQTFTYNDVGEIISAKSPDNKNYSYTYASGNKHRLTKAVSQSSGIQFSYEYNDKGQMNAQQIDDLDTDGATLGKYIRQRQYYTDSKNYVDEEYDNRGYGYKYTWNENRGIITSARDQNNTKTTYTYDADDDYLTSVSKSGSGISYTYDSDNYLKKITSGTTAYHFGYDAFGNIESTKAGSRTLNTNTYNEHNGNLRNSVYGNGFKVGYSYDLKDRITGKYHNEYIRFKWDYNADGQVGKHEDYVNDKTYQYTYDLAGRILRTDISDGSLIRMDYNDISLPTGIHYAVADDGGRDVYFSYAERDNLPKSTTFGTTRKAVNTYDGLGRLDNIKYVTPSADVSDIVANYSYADYGSSTERTTTYVSHIDYSYVSGGLSTNDRFYTYGADGNITEEHRGTSSNRILQEQYVYDSKGQVTKHYSVRNGETWVYTYDNAGNILTKKRYDGVTDAAGLNAASAPTETTNYTYGDSQWGDLLTAYNGKAVTSDAIGNMIGYDGQSWSWKGRQLDSYTNKSGAVTSYKYNADGIRTSKTTGSKTTEYFLNGDQILMMKTTDGSTEDIIWFFYDSQGNRIGLCRNGTYMYYLYNVQGDVVAIASAGTGQLVATYTYDTWGNCEVKELSGYAIGDLNPFRYRGYFWDEESGLYYLNSRYYSPEFGRFISADSQINGDILGTNLFAYCSNNPVNRADRDGRAFDTVLDIGFASYSLWDALMNPDDMDKWGAFFADVVCIFVPGVTGGGAAVRVGAKYGDEVLSAGVKTIDVGKVMKGVRNSADAAFEAGSKTAAHGLCFVAGTPVSTEEGLKAIETIKAGDKVWAENPETGEKALKVVVQTFVNEADELVHVYAGKEKISATPEHPFYVRGKGWTGAIDLKAGDVLVLQDGGYVIVEKTQHEILERPIKVYNFEVEDFHTYYVGTENVLVHNMCTVENGLPQNGLRINSIEALELADNFLGKGYIEMSPGRFVSSNGLRQVRMTASDLATVGNHAGAPHFNFETLMPNPMKPGKYQITGNSHIYIFD